MSNTDSNYRLIKDGDTIGIHLVSYNSAGKITSYINNPKVLCVSGDEHELSKELESIQEAFKKLVLDKTDLDEDLFGCGKHL